MVTFYLRTVTFNQNGNFILAPSSGVCGASVPASVCVSALFLLLWSDIWTESGWTPLYKLCYESKVCCIDCACGAQKCPPRRRMRVLIYLGNFLSRVLFCVLFPNCFPCSVLFCVLQNRQNMNVLNTNVLCSFIPALTPWDFKIFGSYEIRGIKLVLARDLFPSGLFENFNIIIGSEGLTYNFR